VSTVVVTNLRTGDQSIYVGIAPEKAVVCADYQSGGDFNTWAYDFSRAEFGPSGRTVFCGDQAAIREKTE
jgi:hypothetical protein